MTGSTGKLLCARRRLSRIRVHPDDLITVHKVFQQCRTKTVATEFRFLPSDDELAAGLTERWVEASGGPVFDDNGVIVMLSGASSFWPYRDNS
jgi:hypothetical protein